MFHSKLERASIRSYIKVYISFKPSINQTRGDWKRFRRNKFSQEEKQRVMRIQEVYMERIFLSNLRYGPILLLFKIKSTTIMYRFKYSHEIHNSLYTKIYWNIAFLFSYTEVIMYKIVAVKSFSVDFISLISFCDTANCIENVQNFENYEIKFERNKRETLFPML